MIHPGGESGAVEKAVGETLQSMGMDVTLQQIADDLVIEDETADSVSAELDGISNMGPISVQLKKTESGLLLDSAIQCQGGS